MHPAFEKAMARRAVGNQRVVVKSKTVGFTWIPDCSSVRRPRLDYTVADTSVGLPLLFPPAIGNPSLVKAPQPTVAGRHQNAGQTGQSVRKQPRLEKNGAIGETSSWRLPIARDQQSLFQEVLTIFEKSGIQYAVAGAYALHAHTGICRDTKDLDVFLTAENAQAALRCLQQRGFDCETCDPVWLYKAHRKKYFVDLITGMSNAVLTVEDSWIKRAQPAVVEGVRSRVLAPEELLASKLFVTRRERFDGADIAHIIYAKRGELHWDRILALAAESWEIVFWALVLFHYVYSAHSEYVPRAVWRELIARFQEQIMHPDPHAKFRGSLVDEKMFAIDVKEWGRENLLVEFRNRRLQTLGELE
jgi:Nucleotidyl transferase of unknown function (DUF2204)